MPGERRAELLRHAGHLIEALCSAHVQPVPDLPHAHVALCRGHPDRAERVRKLRARHTDQRGLERRHIALERHLFEQRRRGTARCNRYRFNGLQWFRHEREMSGGHCSIDGMPERKRHLTSAVRSAPSRRQERAPWRPRSYRGKHPAPSRRAPGAQSSRGHRACGQRTRPARVAPKRRARARHSRTHCLRRTLQAGIDEIRGDVGDQRVLVRIDQRRRDRKFAQQIDEGVVTETLVPGFDDMADGAAAQFGRQQRQKGGEIVPLELLNGRVATGSDRVFSNSSKPLAKNRSI